MMDCMMEGGGVMMWGMGLFWLLVIIVLLLAAAALVKYLLSGRRTGQRHD
jgi:tellurite resistance protein TehA-like permease